MNKYAELVKEFNDLFCPDATSSIYKKLILEEFNEWWLEWSAEDYKEEQELKELCDLMYVVYGKAHVDKYTLEVRGHELAKINRQVSPDYAHALILGAYVEWLETRDNDWLQNLNTACIAYAKYKEWSLVEAFTRVHASNMSKLEGGKVLRREDGKILKGKDYKPAVLTDLIPKKRKLHKKKSLIIV